MSSQVSGTSIGKVSIYNPKESYTVKNEGDTSGSIFAKSDSNQDMNIDKSDSAVSTAFENIKNKLVSFINNLFGAEGNASAATIKENALNDYKTIGYNANQDEATQAELDCQSQISDLQHKAEQEIQGLKTNGDKSDEFFKEDKGNIKITNSKNVDRPVEGTFTKTKDSNGEMTGFTVKTKSGNTYTYKKQDDGSFAEIDSDGNIKSDNHGGQKIYKFNDNGELVRQHDAKYEIVQDDNNGRSTAVMTDNTDGATSTETTSILKEDKKHKVTTTETRDEDGNVTETKYDDQQTNFWGRKTGVITTNTKDGVTIKVGQTRINGNDVEVSEKKAARKAGLKQQDDGTYISKQNGMKFEWDAENKQFKQIK